MISLVRTDSSNSDFIKLVTLLDADLAVRDGPDHAFYAQFNKIVALKNVVVAYEHNIAVGCGAFRELEPGIVEVKRMYTDPGLRKRGIASVILADLEKWAGELGYHICKLETGIKQPEAIALYKKNGYTQIPNYGQYAGVYNSVCFEKHVN